MKIIGIYGKFATTNLQTSLYEALRDRGFLPVFFGDTETVDTELEQDAYIYLGTHGSASFMESAAATGITGVTLDPSGDVDGWTFIDTNGIVVFGSGHDDITTTIREFIRTGQLTIKGLPEDEYALVEQEDLAEVIASVISIHIALGAMAPVNVWGKDSEVVTLAEFARALWFMVKARVLAADANGTDSGVAPILELPEVIVPVRKTAVSVTTPETTDGLFHVEFASLEDGIVTTLQRLVMQGEGCIYRAGRYAVEDWYLEEPILGIKKDFHSAGANMRARLSGKDWNPRGYRINQELNFYR